MSEFITLQSGARQLVLSQPRLMGILNITPDSFSDGGQFQTVDDALYQAERLLQEGATFLDVGGESTRPGAQTVTENEELARIIPVIEAIAGCFDVWISVDTSKPVVMEAAIKAGAHLINDVRALQMPSALATAVSLDVPVCLMHMQGQPTNMQITPHYDDVVSEVKQFLLNRVTTCAAAGLARQHMMLDPGFGFGKSLAHNVTLVKQLPEIVNLGFAVLVGVSRKSFLGTLVQHDQKIRAVDERLSASVAAALYLAQQGAHILRVHDVGATNDALKIWQAFSA
ncbi:MAG: dihydropteroate synthase [Gammaproteobacteria bacterium]|nr:dihydropteroate synthase [Gammaproteobacteria bacterium]